LLFIPDFSFLIVEVDIIYKPLPDDKEVFSHFQTEISGTVLSETFAGRKNFFHFRGIKLNLIDFAGIKFCGFYEIKFCLAIFLKF